jgi:hypothetical protein
MSTPTSIRATGICRTDGTIVNFPQHQLPAALVPVSAMPIHQRFCEVLRRTLPLLPGEMQQEFAALLSPMNLVIVAGTLAVWAGSHYFGIGFIVDGLLMVVGVLFLGYQIITAASDLTNAVYLTAAAKSAADLDKAAASLANFVAVVGVAAFSALVMKGARRVAPSARATIAAAAAARYGGMTPTHFRVFQLIARLQNRIIGVRNTNPLSTRWIELGYPAKPMLVKAHTSDKTGIVTAVNASEIKAARDVGYYVIDADGIPRNAAGQSLSFNRPPEWPLEPGQVIHPSQHRPLVGDYDLLGVIDPSAPGRNIVEAAANGKVLMNWSNPETRRMAGALNRLMDQPRVLHGAYDGYADVASAKASQIFFPDGTVLQLSTSEAVALFYQRIGRQPIIKPE